jgi:hypothetical protein
MGTNALSIACKNALERGNAKLVSKTAIMFTGKANLAKLAKVEASYSRELRKRQEDREKREREAAKRDW